MIENASTKNVKSAKLQTTLTNYLHLYELKRKRYNIDRQSGTNSFTYYIFFFFSTLKGYWLRDNKNTLKKSHLSPDHVKRAVGEKEAKSEGPVNIRGVLTLFI